MSNPFEKKEKSTGAGTPIEKMSASEVFTYLRDMVQKEETKLLIDLAREEYRDLENRITKEVAKKQIGGLVVTSINAKLSSAENTESGKARTKVFKKLER